MPKWKAFFPNRVKFSRNFWFLRQFLRLLGIFFWVLKTLFGPFIVLKTNVSMPWFQCKIGFKNGPPRAKIFEKKQNGVAVWFCVPCLKFFYKYPRTGWSAFQTELCKYWNRGIETVVLSTIIGTNGVFKYPKKIPMSFKNRLKNPKLRENLTWLGKKAFHLGICDP